MCICLNRYRPTFFSSRHVICSDLGPAGDAMRPNHETTLKHIRNICNQQSSILARMSHHCHDEHSHSHDHSHGGHAHDHGDDITPAIQNTLYDQIDFDGIRCLNEATSGAGRAITKKTWAEREESAPELESDADEQLILHIP
jgi:hypothetical protein